MATVVATVSSVFRHLTGAKPSKVQQPTNTPAAAPPPIVQPNVGMGHDQPQNRTSQSVEPVTGVPVGLELLTPLTHIFVRRENPTFGVTLTPHQHDVFDDHRRRVFIALETIDLSTKRSVILRDFTTDMMDSSGQKILTMRRQIKSCCRGDDLFISLGDGTFLGEFNRIVSCFCAEKFIIKNTHGERILFMRGSHSTTLSIFTTDGEKIGVIKKTKTGYLQEFGGFELEFSRELDVTTKALILAAIFLLDFLTAEAQTETAT